MICPCKGCQDRVAGCHGSCVRYQAFHNEREEIRKARQTDQIGRYALMNSIITYKKIQFKSRRK